MLSLEPRFQARKFKVSFSETFVEVGSFFNLGKLIVAAMASDLDDLVGFLASPSPQLKKAAVDIVQGLTGAEDGLSVLTSKSAQLLPPLLNLLAETQDIAQPAAEALVNLSQDNKSVDEFLKAGAVEKVMELIGKTGCGINRLLVMLLVNLTQVESGAKRLLQV